MAKVVNFVSEDLWWSIDTICISSFWCSV